MDKLLLEDAHHCTEPECIPSSCNTDTNITSLVLEFCITDVEALTLLDDTSAKRLFKPTELGLELKFVSRLSAWKKSNTVSDVVSDDVTLIHLL